MMSTFVAVRPAGAMNAEWLRQRYECDQHSINDICRETGRTYGSVQYWMKTYGIGPRSKSYSQFLRQSNQDVVLSPEAIQFIEGELLGDGSLRQASPQCIWSAIYAAGSRSNTYLQWLAGVFQGFGVAIAGRIYSYDKPLGHVYQYSSRSYAALGPMRQRWYPAGKKVVPTDLVLTPLMARQWYIGDGCLPKRKQRRRPEIRISTNAFTYPEVHFLRESLVTHGFKTTVGRDREKPVLNMSSRSVPDFLDWIGPCPEPILDIYGYKWEVG